MCGGGFVGALLTAFIHLYFRSFATSEKDKPKLVAVAALLQGSTSAICTLKSSGIDTPAKLEGKRYASYGGRFEGEDT